MTTYAEHEAWANALTYEQLVHAIYEMRNRGWAVTVYEACDAFKLFDLNEEPEDDAWFDRQEIEEAMRDAARDQMQTQLEAAGAL